MKIWKLILAVAVNCALFITTPFLLEWLGLVAPLTPKAGWILGITVVGLVLKILFGDLASGGFEYHRHGYDFCIVTLGAALSSISVQLTTDRDLFPGLSGLSALLRINLVTKEVITQRIFLLVAILLASCILALLTARISSAIREGNAQFPNLLSLLNFVLGVGLFGVYVLILITKG